MSLLCRHIWLEPRCQQISNLVFISLGVLVGNLVPKNLKMVTKFFFQLEIIGDGYVVVSGLPKENGLAHGTEICKMALELMHQVWWE